MAGKEKKTDTLRLPPEGLEETMKRDFQDKASTWRVAWSHPM